MPIYSVQGPDGRIHDFEGPEGASQEQVLAFAAQHFAELPTKEQPKEGFLPALEAGFKNIQADMAALAGRTGVIDADKAEKFRKEKEQEAKDIYRPTDKGWLESPLTKLGELAGGSLPYMAAPIAAGALAPEGLAAMGATGLASALQFTGSNISRQIQEGKTLGQTNLGAAVGAAVPQAALDVFSLHMIPGIKGIFGEVGEKLTDAQAKEIAQQGLKSTLKDYAVSGAKSFGTEGLTEAGQQVLERLQAGLNLNDPDARQEYLDNFLGGGVLGGVLGVPGRAIERMGARSQAAQAQLEEQKQQQIQALKEQQTAEEAEAQRKQDPAYMEQFVQNYETLQNQYKELQKQTKKPDMKTALPSDIEQYNQNREQLSGMRKQLAADSQEYLQLRPQYNQIRAQQAQQAQAAQDQRYQQMELAGAQDQTAAQQPYYQSPQGVLPGMEAVPQQPVTEPKDPRKLYERVQALQQAKDEHQQQENEIVANGDPEAYEAFVKQRETVDKAHADAVKELKEAGGYTPAPPHPSIVAQDAYNKAVEKWQKASGAGTPGYDPEKAAKLYPAVKAAKDNLEQVVNQYGVAQRDQQQTGFDFGPESEFKEQHITSKEEAAAKRYKPGAPQAESEEQAYLEEQRRQEEQAREEARFQPTFWRNKQEELNEMGRISEREGPEMDFSLRPPETLGGTAAMGQMQQNLQGIKPGEGLLHTAEERAPARKSPTEPYRGLYASPVEGPEYQADRARLEERLARVMSDHEMPQETYALLRRAEEALAVPNPDPTFMRTLDEQLTEIESGREGMPRKGAPVGTQKLQALPIGQTAVSKIVPKENVLRGPSAKVKPLSRQAELEEQLRTSEQARGEGPVKEKQLSLFPEEEEKLGTVRANPAQFQRFLNSDKVKKLRQSLDKDLGELQKLSTVDELRSRVEELTKQVNAMESVNLEYKQAQQTIRHQRDVGKQRHDVTQLRQALVSGVIKRMDLQGKLDELIKERTEIEQQAKANSIGGWEGYDPDLFANLNHVQEQYQNAVNEVAVMQGALSTLEGRLKVEEAKIKIAKLNPLTTPKATFEAAKKELEAAREDLGRAQKEASAEILANKDREARERRAREAIQDAETKRLNDQIARARQTRLEAMYGESVRGTEYPMIEEARRLAREDIEQERYRKPAESKEEQSARANPNGYLAYLRGQITKLEKVMQNSYQTSNEARMKPIEELRKKADALNKQYRETESADAREKMLPRIEAAEKEYDEAVDRMSVMPLTWKGMAKQQNDLRKLYIAAERIEDRIQAGDLVQPEARRAPPTKKKEPKNQVAKAQKVVNELKDKLEGLDVTQEDKRTNLEGRLLKATDVLNKAKEAEAAKNKVETKAAKERATAPKPSEPPLTKTDIKEATQQGGTVYTGKGVGEELQSKVAKEVKTKEIVENENKYKELKAKKPSELNAMQKAFIAMYEYKYGGEKTGLADQILNEGKKKPQLSRGATTNGLTKAELQKELGKALGEKGFTAQDRFATTDRYGNPTPSKLGIYESVDDFLKTNPEYEGLIPQDAKGFAEGQNAYLFANNIEKGQALGVLLHEVGTHIGFKNFFDAKQYSDLVNTVKGWAKLNDGSIEAKVGRSAMERVKEANTSAEHVDDELLAYAVEEAVKAGVKPEGMGVLKNWLNKVVQAFKNALAKLGFAPEKLSAGDLVNFAYGCANLELRGTWHGSDAKFTAFDKTKAGTGEGAFDRRFEKEKSLGGGPYVTPDKEYAEYYQHAVPFGKAANDTGYGNKSYQNYRDMDELFMTKSNSELNPDELKSKFESRLLTHYLQGVSRGEDLNPEINTSATRMLNRLQKEASTDAEKKAVRSLDLAKIKPLKDYPKEGNLYRTLDNVPRKNVYSVNSDFVYGDRPAIDALLKKYGDSYAQKQAETKGKYPANGLFYDMRKNLGIEKTTQLLKDAGIEAIEQINDRRYIERAYIDQAPEILGMNLEPVGVTKGLLFSRNAKYNNADYANIGAIADKFIAKEKTFAEKIKANATGLAFVTQLVDRFAGFERLAKTMEALKGSQMMYYLRMYDQRMNFVSQSVANGALRINEKVRADGRKEYIIESKAGPSLKSTVQVLKEATPIVGNGEAVNRLFTLYMSAIRAKDKGFDALHFGNNITEAELNQAKRTIDADPKLKDIFDRARDQYNQYNRDQVNFAVQSGAFSKELAARLLKENDYIPWYRQRNGVAELIIGNENPIRVGSIAEQPYLQELVGGDTPILDFMTSAVQNTNMIADMGLRNLATKNAIFELVDMDLAHISKKKLAGPGIVKFKVDGEDRYAIVDTDKVGVPADILIKGMEGIPTQMPFAFRIMGIPAKLLRKTVTASPLYAARQLFRDSLAAPILAGADFTPVLGSLKEINSATKATLEQRGITGGQVFTGTNEDLSKILKDIVNDKPGWMNSLAKWEAMSMEADATTRRAQYNSYIQQGLSEMEATLMSLESMNFNKRGASPSIHIVNSLIPFFNAQIQSLNVLYKAITGKLPFNEKLKIQEKLLTRGAMMAASTLAYAMMMQDDEAYKNATPDQKYNNWFVRLPGLDEPVRLPIPFEIGYIFKALPEALYNTIMTKHGGEDAAEAFSGIAKNLIPGGSSYGIPQALKPAIEAGLGKSFYTGNDILTRSEQNLLPQDQFRANTTEAAKAFGKATGTSPIMLEHLVNGYTGTLGLAFLQAVSMGIPKGSTPEQTAGRLSELPVVGGAFQPNDAGGIISNVYKRMDNIKKVANTIDSEIAKGNKAEAMDLLHKTGNEYAASEVADYYTSTMKDLTSYENAVRASKLSPDEKRKKLDELRQAKIKFANTVRDATDKTVHQ